MSPDLILNADHLRRLLATIRPEIDDCLARYPHADVDRQLVAAFELFVAFFDCPFEEVPTGRDSERVKAANTYFWFSVYTRLHRVRVAKDVGLDQQAFNIWAETVDTIGEMEAESITRVIESTVHQCRMDATLDIIDAATSSGR